MGAAQAQDWDGWYAGLGYESSDYSFSIPTGTHTFTINGVAQDIPEEGGKGSGATLIAGRLWQRDKLVYGLELNIGGANAAFDAPVTDPGDPSSFCSPNPCSLIGTRTELETRGRVRGMLGFAASDKFMFYAGLGVASAESRPTGTYFYWNAGTEFGSWTLPGSLFADKIVNGPSLSLGAQYKLNPRLSLRGELVRDSYEVHYDAFGSASTTFISSPYDVQNIMTTGNATDGTTFDITNTSAQLSLVFSF